MYLGWNFCEKTSRSNEKETCLLGLSFPNNAAICLRIESEILMADGEKLNDAPGEVGAGLLQFMAQHNCAALTVFMSIFFFLQHSIADIPPSALPAKSGVPASVPPARAKSRKSDVSHFFIVKSTILNKLKFCQELYSFKLLFYSLFSYASLFKLVQLSCQT